MCVLESTPKYKEASVRALSETAFRHASGFYTREVEVRIKIRANNIKQSLAQIRGLGTVLLSPFFLSLLQKEGLEERQEEGQRGCYMYPLGFEKVPARAQPHDTTPTGSYWQ